MQMFTSGTMYHVFVDLRDSISEPVDSNFALFSVKLYVATKKKRVSRDGSPYPSVSWIIPCIALQFWAWSICVASLGIMFAFEDDPGFNLFVFALDVCGVIRQGCVERSILSRKRVSWLGGPWGLEWLAPLS